MLRTLSSNTVLRTWHYLSCSSSIIRCYSFQIVNKYTEAQKEKILKLLNEEDAEKLSRYDISKPTLRKLSQWKKNNQNVKFESLSDVGYLEGLTERSAKKLFDTLLDDSIKEKKITKNIKGQILQPPLDEQLCKKCTSVLAIYIAVNSICWALINRSEYEVLEWKYHGLNCKDGKKFQITDIFELAWNVTKQLPNADIYVMKAEATSLRATGSDPNNPKLISVNLQKAQMTAMIVALLNCRHNDFNRISEGYYQAEKSVNQRVYFLRPTLPYRLYGTLVGNEKVSTDQTVEMLLQEIKHKSPDNSNVYISEDLKSMFRSEKELQKDMLGHCLLLGLTFMDLCIYKNSERIEKLLKNSR